MDPEMDLQVQAAQSAHQIARDIVGSTSQVTAPLGPSTNLSVEAPSCQNFLVWLTRSYGYCSSSVGADRRVDSAHTVRIISEDLRFLIKYASGLANGEVNLPWFSQVPNLRRTIDALEDEKKTATRMYNLVATLQKVTLYLDGLELKDNSAASQLLAAALRGIRKRRKSLAQIKSQQVIIYIIGSASVSCFIELFSVSITICYGIVLLQKCDVPFV